MKILFILVVVTLIFIAAIIRYAEYEQTLPPHWEEVCDSGYYQTQLTPVFVNGSITMIHNNIWICTKSHEECVTGSNYTGPIKTCEAN